MSEIYIVFKWLLVLQICGFAGSLLFLKGTNNNILRYAIGKSIGVVILAAATWVFSLLKIAPFNYITALLLLVLTYSLLGIFRYQEIKLILKKNKKPFFIIEASFLMLYIIGVTLRSFNPAIVDIEKYMDMAILTGLIRHNEGVPIDTWYAPDTINYYYFGHWIIALLAKLSNTAASYAFNLGLPSALALAGTNILCTAWSLGKKLYGGILAVFFALFASNLHPFLSYISGNHDYFFYNSGRFAEQVINEYPLYSFILGDLHAHMLGLILCTAFYGLLVLLVLEKPIIKDKLLIITAGGLVGLMMATNAFDVISALIVCSVLFSFLIITKKVHLIFFIKPFIIFTTVAILSSSLFLLNFDTAVGGLGLNILGIPLMHILWQFGIPFTLIAATLILSKILKIIIVEKDNIQIAILFALAGLALIALPELVFVKDIYYYQNPPFMLANTVFKIWYTAWILVAIASSVLITLAIDSSKTFMRKNILTLLIIASVAITGVGLINGLKLISSSNAKSLNGLAYLNSTNSERLKVIEWVNQNLKGQPILLQIDGDSYSQLSWASSYTGLPTILGWRSHEWGWRYSADRWDLISARSAGIRLLYESGTTSKLASLSKRYNIDYVLIGPDEKFAFDIKESLFDKTFGLPKYDSGGYKIYQVN